MMMVFPTPREILATLLPQLKLAAAYAQQIQGNIAAQPAKDYGDNFFATALTDADLSVQTFIEVALLAQFPRIRFFGEEHEQAFNTKYFRGIDLGNPGDFLVTLDPIDGTRFYMDGHANYQVILTILNADAFEAVIALSPAQNQYFYALRGQGAFTGQFEDNLEDCQPLRVSDRPAPSVLLGWNMDQYAAHLPNGYRAIDVRQDYSPTAQIPNVNGVLSGDLCGVLLSRGKFIDGGALAFLAQEMGCLVTDLAGMPLPPLYACRDYQWPALVIATSAQVHQDLLHTVSQAPQP